MGGAGDYDIFVSYTHEDTGVAKRLAEELSARGWSVFWDRVLLPGATWRSQIQSALSSSRVVLVLWSERSVNSRWVEVEADHAFQRDAYMPVTIDNAPLPLGLSHVQVADLRQWNAEAGHLVPEVLISALQRRLGGKPVAAPSAPTAAPIAVPPPSEPVPSDATAVAAEGSINLSGKATTGEPFSLTVRLSQLRMKPEGLVIGRKRDTADLVLAHVSVSRRHALLKSSDGRLIVADLGSTNGTFVNDRPALAERPGELVRGAVLRLGEVELQVEGSQH
jgi:hypothetical protein